MLDLPRCRRRTKNRRDRRGRLWYVTSLAAGHERLSSLRYPLAGRANGARDDESKSQGDSAIWDCATGGEGGRVIRALFLISWDKAAAF